MQSTFRYITLVVFGLLALATQSCKRSVENYTNVVIQTPYSLYYTDTMGTVYNTNDGDTVKRLVFPPDGFLSRAIATSGNNILLAKVNLHVSLNNGSNFNPTYLTLNPAAIDQSLILDVPDQGRVYIAGTGATGAVFSDTNGKQRTWQEDTLYENNVSGAAISSFTRLSNGTIIGLDRVARRSFKKEGKNEKWKETTGDPANTTTNLPSSTFSLGHYNNTVVAIDRTGANGAWYSQDMGKTWYKYTGLPARPLHAVSSPFDETLLIGTDSAGLYRLQTGTDFAAVNEGLAQFTVVNGITFKENLYKNSKTTSARFIYLATNHGLYRSQDMGLNWVRVQEGNYINIY